MCKNLLDIKIIIPALKRTFPETQTFCLETQQHIYCWILCQLIFVKVLYKHTNLYASHIFFTSLIFFTTHFF